MIKKINLKDVSVSFFFSLIGVLLLKAYCDAVENQELSMLLKYTFCHLHSIKIWTAILFFAVILFFYKTNFKKINDFLYKYRFSIVFVCFILCVFFEITGSSLGLWNIYFGEKDKDVLFGVSRAIRSDEWAIFTPLGISQYYNYSGSFPYFSDTVRACSTDVFIEYGQAVKNLLIIYRPFFWGYLFLPVAKGMAFFWCGRLFALMLVSFEFGLLLTNKNKLLSLTMAVLITYAPVVQWWFAINGLVEMLVYTQLSVLMLKKYMTDSRFLFRLLYLFVILICAGGYVLTFYPPWMIPCAYILVALAAWVFLENRTNCKMRISDWVSTGVSVLIFAVSMMYLYHMSKETCLIKGLELWR